MAKTVGGTTTHFHYDAQGTLIAESDAQGQTSREYVWLDSTPVAVIENNTAYFIHADHLDTPRVVTNQANTIIWRWDSDPFGVTAPLQDPDGNGQTFVLNLRLPGQYFDNESNLHYNYYRDYDPQIGRYVQSDPIGLKGGINTYAYVGGNPVGAIDPLGLTQQDMEYIFSQVVSQFQDLQPSSSSITFYDPPSGQVGRTNRFTGEISMPSEYARLRCLSEREWEDVFYTLFHEGMHSTDPWYKGIFGTSHHKSIYARETYERTRGPKSTPPSPIWGTPRATPVDDDTLYRQYRENSPDCLCSR